MVETALRQSTNKSTNYTTIAIKWVNFHTPKYHVLNPNLLFHLPCQPDSAGQLKLSPRPGGLVFSFTCRIIGNPHLKPRCENEEHKTIETSSLNLDNEERGAF